MKKSEFNEIHSYMWQSLREHPLAANNIRISVYQDDTFVQYLDVPNDIPDSEITETCVEVFGAGVEWEHFSCPERFDGLPERTPPAMPPDTLRYRRFD